MLLQVFLFLWLPYLLGSGTRSTEMINSKDTNYSSCVTNFHLFLPPPCSCWISVNHGAIWAFTAPMLAIIAVSLICVQVYLPIIILLYLYCPLLFSLLYVLLDL